MTLAIKDANTATQNLNTVNVGGEHMAVHVIADPVVPAQKALVTAAGALKVDNTGATQPVQDVADGPVTPGTVAGKSQLGGAQYNPTLPAVASGQQVALQCDAAGRLLVNPVGPIDLGSLITLASATNNVYSSTDQVNLGSRGVLVVINVTVMGAGTMAVSIQGKDPASSAYYTILTSASLATTGTTVIRIYPGGTAVANVAGDHALPANWRIQATVGGGTPNVTATIAACLLP